MTLATSASPSAPAWPRTTRTAGASAARTADDQRLRPIRCSRRSGSARSGRRAWAGVSTTSRCPTAIPTSSTRLRGRRSVQVREQRHHLGAGVRRTRDGVDRRHRDSSDQPEHRLRRHRRSRTTGRPRRSATASTRPPTAARPSRTSACSETQTIARIVIDPQNPETVYVAVPGHLFGPNKERGVYKTTDGGRNWNLRQVHRRGHRLHRHRDRSGRTPTSSTRASYQRRRMGCCFNGGGPGSALWKTTDGGRNWTKLTGGPAARHLRTHRARRVALESERRLRADRGRSDRSAADDRRERSRRGDREHAGRRGGVPGAPPSTSAVRRGRRTPAGRGGRRPPAPAGRGSAAAGGGGGGRGRLQLVQQRRARRAASAAARSGRIAAADAAAARCRTRRHLPLRQQGRQLDARQQLQCAADVLQPDSRRSDATTRPSTSPACQ